MPGPKREGAKARVKRVHSGTEDHLHPKIRRCSASVYGAFCERARGRFWKGCSIEDAATILREGRRREEGME